MALSSLLLAAACAELEQASGALPAHSSSAPALPSPIADSNAGGAALETEDGTRRLSEQTWEGLCLPPVFSQDRGFALLVQCGVDGAPDVLVHLDLSTGRATTLGSYRLAGHGEPMGPSWRPTDVKTLLVDGGNHFAFGVHGAAGHEVHVQEWSLAGPARVVPVQPVNHHPILHTLSISPDGRLIAVASRSYRAGIFGDQKDALVVIDSMTGARIEDFGSGIAGKLERLTPAADSSGFLATFETEDRSGAEAVDLIRMDGIHRVLSVITGSHAEQFYRAGAWSPSGTTFLMTWGVEPRTQTWLVDAVTRRRLRAWEGTFTRVRALGAETLLAVVPKGELADLVRMNRSLPTSDEVLATLPEIAGIEVTPDGQDVFAFSASGTHLVSTTGAHVPIALPAGFHRPFFTTHAALFFSEAGIPKAVSRLNGAPVAVVPPPFSPAVLLGVSPSGSRMAVANPSTRELWTSSRGGAFVPLGLRAKLDAQVLIVQDDVILEVKAGKDPQSPLTTVYDVRLTKFG